MTDSPRDFRGALAFAQAQAAHPTQDWTNYCLQFVRSSYAIPPLFLSAYAQWLGADPEDRHPTTNLDDAMIGAALCTKGTSPSGHIYLAAFPFRSALSAAWSNDLVREGDIDKVGRTRPMTEWGHRPLGFLTAVNGYDLQVRDTHAKAPKPAKPKQDKQYKAVDLGLQRIEHALKTATAQHDVHDVRVLTREVAHLKGLYAELRHA